MPHLAILKIILAISLLATPLSCSRTGPQVSLDPEQFSATARIDPHLKIELAAMEPNVVDPVSLCFDADGRMYVVEMRDYPVERSAPIGRVRLLEDPDLDGYYDKATLFAEGLRYPTSVLPWRGGVLVVSPPDIVFFRDTDGDGRADVKEVLFSGFPVENTQHNVNGLIWGVDNWVYAANGGNNGIAYSTRSPEAKLSLRRQDFRFRPGSGVVETSYESTGGFGIAMDSWGRMFGTHNTDHIQHMPLPSRYLARNPLLALPSARDQISDHGSSAPLFQISDAETRVNHPEQSGRFSGGCGLTFYGGGALGPGVNDSFFVTDVVVNVVHQDRITPKGASFKASRVGERVEFLAGKDNWFRPVNLSVGPEGALYLLDMHRAVIEHPEWIPDAVERNLNVRAGDDKGRIYRIAPINGLERVNPNLSDAPVETLVAALARPNKWWRDTAQRLLVERQDAAAVPLLEKSARDGRSPEERLHSLWTLEGLGALPTPQVLSALGDPHPGVRENGVRLSEPLLSSSAELRAKILEMSGDADPRVRLQVALSLGQVDDSRTPGALIRILSRDAEDPWARYAVLSSFGGGRAEALRELLVKKPAGPCAGAGCLDFVAKMAAMVGAEGSQAGISSLIGLCGEAKGTEEWTTSLLEGLAEGLGRAESKPKAGQSERAALERMMRSEDAPSVRAALLVADRLGAANLAAGQKALARAQQRALDESLPVEARLREETLLSLGTYDQVGKTLHALMEPRQPVNLQEAGARTMSQIADARAAKAMLADWRRYSPQVKSIVLNTLLRRNPFHELLIDALERRRLTFGELNLDLEQRRRLLRRSTPEIMKRAAALFGDEEFSNRKEIVGKYVSSVLPLRGEASKGESHYRTLCAKCHTLSGVGTKVGPDLNMAFAKGKEDLLTSILDPNAAIAPEYTNYLITTTKGDVLSGIIGSETPNSISLKRAEGESDTVLRSEIRDIRTDGQSLMPEGLEKGLRPADLADLLAFLQQHRH